MLDLTHTLHKMIEKQTFNILDFQKQYDMNENETNILMDAFQDQEFQAMGEPLGRTLS